MAKSKQAPALFEVIQSQQAKKGPGGLALPKWWRSGRAAEAPPQAQDKPAPESGQGEPAPAPGTEPKPASPAFQARQADLPGAAPPAVERPAAGSAAPTGETRRWADQDEPVHPPVFSVRAGRVEISLNAVNAVVVAGGILLALLCSYHLGARLGPAVPSQTDRTAQTEPVDTIPEALAGAPDPDVLDVGPGDRAPGSAAGREPTPAVAARPDHPRTPPAGAVERVSGSNYVVIESFKAEDENDARHAQQWLAGKNVVATLERTTSGDYWLLISVVGFDYPDDKEQCQQYCEAVKALGQEYRQAFAGERAIRYDFRSPAIRKWK